MIVTALTAVAYRIHDPRWAHAPLSGAGAAKYGGRLNRPGINALYLSLELETALAEYKQLDALVPPALLVSYQLVVDRVVDFRKGYTGAWSQSWQDLACDWRRIVFNEGGEPPSWAIGEEVLAAGCKGILFNSVVTKGTNLVLYTDSLGPGDRVEAHDPNHALPKNQDSWS